jgi:long-chain acyl-CoA synthetase
VALIQGFDQNSSNVNDMERQIQQKIDTLNQQLPSFAQIKKWALLSENLSVENGTLTPTLKVRRTLVHERFKAQIDGLYLQ